jgi:hypothetical protein
MTKSNRAGITSAGLTREPLTNRSDSIKPQSRGSGGARIVHTIVGGFLGTLAGAGLGAGVGAVVDSRAKGSDAMIPGSVILGFYGAVLGLVSGLVVGVLWPVH